MEYQVGKVGRSVVARLFEGEDIYAQIEGLARRENIRCASVLLVGGMSKGKVVVGPKSPKPADPIEPNFFEFDDAREIAGVGTIFWDESGPKMHLHAGIGRGSQAVVGCPRGGASVFCVLEVVIVELTDIDAARKLDPQTGLKLLSLGSQEAE
jgi:predicted DNA-binding protein with PD1-like motif